MSFQLKLVVKSRCFCKVELKMSAGLHRFSSETKPVCAAGGEGENAGCLPADQFLQCTFFFLHFVTLSASSEGSYVVYVHRSTHKSCPVKQKCKNKFTVQEIYLEDEAGNVTHMFFITVCHVLELERTENLQSHI